MKRKMLLTLMLMVAAVLMARASFATDPLEADPDMYKFVYQNDRVRVLEVTFEPGQDIPFHSHPDHFAYILEGGNLHVTNEDGTETDAELKAGDVVWFDAVTHKAVNTGTTRVHALVTELKEPKPAAVVAEAVQ